jgi:very-short-patch-repair endonuclease
MWTDDDYRKRRAVRHSPTRLERWLFEVLNESEIRYEEFATVGRYVPDALLPDHHVILEVDGVKWHRGREAYDKQRDIDLAAKGFVVMHFTDIELISRPRAKALLEEAVAEIKAGRARYRPAKLWKVNPSP